MRNFLFILTFITIQTTFAQKCTLTGYVKSLADSSVIPFADIELLNNNDNVIGKATTDFDGKYIIKVDSIFNEYYKIKAKYVCYYDPLVLNVKISNSTKNNECIFLRPIYCKETNKNNCPQFSESCKVIRIVYVYPGYRIPKKALKAQTKGEIIYRKSAIGDRNCCLNRWYCKTHKKEY